MNMSGRTFSAGSATQYRYGFNGKELDNTTGEGNLDFGARILDVRLGRWLSVDAFFKSYPNYSSYSFGACNPTSIVDYGGNWLVDKDGNPIYTVGKNFAEVSKDGKEIWYGQVRYYFTNDGQKVFTVSYFAKTDKGNTVFNKKDNTYKIIDNNKVENKFDYDLSYDCHANSCFDGPPYIPGSDDNKNDNVSKIFKNQAEFIKINEKQIKPGDIAIFEKNGEIQHSATLDANLTLTSKNDRDPIRLNQTTNDIETYNQGEYGKLSGYYRHQGSVGLSISSNMGEIDASMETKVVSAAKSYQEKKEKIISLLKKVFMPFTK